MQNLAAEASPSIQEVAHVVGLMVASFPAVKFAPLFYRALERDKTHALKVHKGNYTASMTLSQDALEGLKWWISNVETSLKPVQVGKPDIVIQSDASTSGWGAYCDGKRAGGPWSDTEVNTHINVLETTAAFLALQFFCSAYDNKHIRLEMDNTTTVSYVNNMGGNHSSECNATARQMWLWCIQRNIWLSASHIPGVTNVEADRLSRQINDHTEWALNDEVFNRICTQLFRPQVDMFASRLNKKLPQYVSWQPDPQAFAVDAFSQNWATQSFYAFPPFRLLTKVLQKIQEDMAEGIVVVPFWPTQPWYPVAMQMLVDQPRMLSKMQKLYIIPTSQFDQSTPTTSKAQTTGLSLGLAHLTITPKSRHFKTGCPYHPQIMAEWHPPTVPNLPQQVDVVL